MRTPFKQGPMSRNDAENIFRVYKQKGRDVVIAESMNLDSDHDKSADEVSKKIGGFDIPSFLNKDKLGSF